MVSCDKQLTQKKLNENAAISQFKTEEKLQKKIQWAAGAVSSSVESLTKDKNVWLEIIIAKINKQNASLMSQSEHLRQTRSAGNVNFHENFLQIRRRVAWAHNLLKGI